MLKEEICKLREKLNESIISGLDYEIIYKLSVELDELIAEFYRKELGKNSSNINENRNKQINIVMA